MSSLVDSTGHTITAQHNIVTVPTASLEMMQWQAQCEFDVARFNMDGELPTIIKEGQIQFGSGKPIPFVRFEDLHAIIMPFVRKFGFYVSFQGVEKSGRQWAQAFLRRNGVSIMSEWPVDGTPLNKAVNPNQANAAGFSLACRHALIRLLNIRSLAPQDADTDAIVKAQTPVKRITPKQRMELEVLIDGDDLLMERIKNLIFKDLEIENLSQLPAAQFGMLKVKIKTYNARKAEAAK